VNNWAPQQVGATPIPHIPTFWWLLSATSAGLSTYHGYKRNLSIPWALWWALTGGLFPIVVPAIAVAQGFGKRA